MTRPAVFTDARVLNGPTLYVSGQTPVSSDGEVPDGADAQTRVVLGKIAAVLAQHGLDWGAVAKVTYYLRDIADLDAVRAALLDVLPQPRPAATLVEISGLIDPRFLIEIDAVAGLG